MYAKTKLIRKAIKLFKRDYIQKSTWKHNVRQWLKSVDSLGDKWIVAHPLNKQNG